MPRNLFIEEERWKTELYYDTERRNSQGTKLGVLILEKEVLIKMRSSRKLVREISAFFQGKKENWDGQTKGIELQVVDGKRLKFSLRGYSVLLDNTRVTEREVPRPYIQDRLARGIIREEPSPSSKIFF